MVKKEYPELTVLSGIAILFVLLIHASGSALGAIYPEMTYAQADFLLRAVANLVSPAVPIFVFLAGYKYALNSKDTPYIIFLRKRLPKVIVSFAIINTLFWLLDSIVWMEHFDAVLLIKTYISSWLGNTVAYPLWFIPMYCCVIIACPLANRIIKNHWMRLILYLAIGIVQKHLGQQFSVIGSHPFTFLAYPIFFELGQIAQEFEFRQKIKQPGMFCVCYIVGIVVLAWGAPEASVSLLVKFWLGNIIGVFAYFSLGIVLKNNRILQYLGKLSYPIFLLHEPVIGRFLGRKLTEFSIHSSTLYVILWLLGVLILTLVIIYIFQFFHMDRLLWRFSAKGVK